MTLAGSGLLGIFIPLAPSLGIAWIQHCRNFLKCLHGDRQISGNGAVEVVGEILRRVKLFTFS